MEKSLLQQLGHESSEILNESFLSKLKFCSQRFDFTDENKEIKEKNDRLFYLQQISDLLQESNAYQAMIIPHFEQLILMVEANIFRPLSVHKKAVQQIGESELEVNETLVNANWQHLQPVYDIFLQAIVSDSMETEVLLQCVTKKFIHSLLQLFDSGEPREREYVKNLYHRLYGKLVPRRRTFRKAIGYIFSTLIHETFHFAGMAELLDIFASIISGFQTPLLEEHTTFFKNSFLPLHKVQTYNQFQEQLQRCTMLFLNKMPSLAVEVVETLLKHWPFANSYKELCFLSELLEVLEMVEMEEVQAFAEPLFKRLVKCIGGSHLQIADRAMCYFENDYFVGILREYKQIAFPLFVPVIHRIADTHWHRIQAESLLALRQILRELDPVGYEKALTIKHPQLLYLTQDHRRRAEDKSKNEQKWLELTKKAKNIIPSLQLTIIPYTDKEVIGDHNRIHNTNVVLN